MMTSVKKKGILGFIFLGVLISVWWSFSADHLFCFDDSELLARASLHSYGELFSFYPHQIYLSRPIRDIVTKAFYDLFGINHVQHHAALVAIHLLNTALLYQVALRLFGSRFGRDNSRAFIGAAAAAAFFGIWFQGNMAVFWVSAICDLIGTTFALLSIWFFLKNRQDDAWQGQSLLLSILFFYIAIRTKELFYTVPFLFVLYDVWIATIQKQKLRISKATLVQLAVMMFFLVGMLYLKMTTPSITADAENPYYQSMNPLDLIRNLVRYCMMLFDLENGGFTYAATTSGAIGAGVVLLGLGVAVYLAIAQKRFSLLLCYFAIAFSIALVLPQINMVHTLYLYFPKTMVALLLGCVISGLPARNGLALGAAVCLLLWGGQAPANRSFQAVWLDYGRVEGNAWKDILQLPAPSPGTTVYVFDESGGCSPFFYGPGSVVQLLYQDATLQTVRLSSGEQPAYVKPYLVWYCGVDGHVTELERNDERERPVLEGFYPNPIAASGREAIDVGISSNRLSEVRRLQIEGQEMRFFMGETFFSSTIPYALLEGKESISVRIQDMYGLWSEEMRIPVQQTAP